jgi:hypothetical protein
MRPCFTRRSTARVDTFRRRLTSYLVSISGIWTTSGKGLQETGQSEVKLDWKVYYSINGAACQDKKSVFCPCKCLRGYPSLPVVLYKSFIGKELVLRSRPGLGPEVYSKKS